MQDRVDLPTSEIVLTHADSDYAPRSGPSQSNEHEQWKLAACSTDPAHCPCCSDEGTSGRIVRRLAEGMAIVEFGSRTEEVNVELVEADCGDVVLVHAGVAVGTIGRIH